MPSPGIRPGKDQWTVVEIIWCWTAVYLCEEFVPPLLWLFSVTATLQALGQSPAWRNLKLEDASRAECSDIAAAPQPRRAAPPERPVFRDRASLLARDDLTAAVTRDIAARGLNIPLLALL